MKLQAGDEIFKWDGTYKNIGNGVFVDSETRDVVLVDGELVYLEPLYGHTHSVSTLKKPLDVYHISTFTDGWKVRRVEDDNTIEFPFVYKNNI